jgi:hypothetical protein
MVYRGRVSNGVVVLEEGANLREGTEVRVEVAQDPPRKTLYERLENVAGKATGLPDDFAEQHDHYIHGTPKK